MPHKITIFTHPDTGEVYEYRGFGRMKAWCKELIEKGLVPDIIRAQPKVILSVQEDPNAVKYYRYTGIRDEDSEDYTKYSTVSCRCIVGVIGDEAKAIYTLNKTFKNEVSLSEFNAAWKRIDNDKVFLNNRVGVFTNDGKSAEWVERPIINKGRV